MSETKTLWLSRNERDPDLEYQRPPEVGVWAVKPTKEAGRWLASSPEVLHDDVVGSVGLEFAVRAFPGVPVPGECMEVRLVGVGGLPPQIQDAIDNAPMGPPLSDDERAAVAAADADVAAGRVVGHATFMREDCGLCPSCGQDLPTSGRPYEAATRIVAEVMALPATTPTEGEQDAK